MEITHLADFLSAGGARYQVYDMGRRVTPLADFAAIAGGQRPYAYPLQQQAWLGILFWQQQPYVWFVKLGLDEQGLINQGHAAQFMAQVLTAMQEGRDALPDNPYTFTPSDEKRAAFHSQARLFLGEPASLYYEQAAAFTQGQHQDWQRLGLQGLADLAVRDRHTEAFIAMVAKAPLPVLQALAGQLENLTIAKLLADALWARFDEAPLVLARALARSTYAAEATDRLLSAAVDINTLAVIAGRLFDTLVEPQRLTDYLTQAASVEQGQYFNDLFADLVMLPQLRPALLAKLRDPERSEILAKAMGGLIG